MNVLIDWEDSRPGAAYPNTERVILLSEQVAGSVTVEKGELYVNPQKVRSFRVVDDEEGRGERLVNILLYQDDRLDGETLEDMLLRIIRERDEARAGRVPLALPCTDGCTLPDGHTSLHSWNTTSQPAPLPATTGVHIKWAVKQ